MALSNGPNLGILVDGAIGEVHYDALMQQWRAMDALVQPRVKSATINTPPVSPSDGDCYIVPSGATGVWSGNTNKIARYSSKQTAWEYYTPKNGWVVHNEATSSFIKYNGTAWVDPIINKADLVDGKIPASQLPSYVDDILEFPDLASFPVTGESGKIYVAIDTGNSYRWSGSVYTKISQPLDEIPQVEAETGTASTLRAITARRLFQAAAAWWASVRTSLAAINSSAITENNIPVVVQTDIGTDENQIPLNAYLGGLAYMSPDRLVLKPQSSVVPASPEEMVFELTDDNTLKIKVRVSDGTLKSVTFALV